MKKKQLYEWISLVMVGICLLGMCAIGVRIFARKILIGKLGIETYVTCALADYNWGDRLERTFVEKKEEKKPKRLETLETMLDNAPKEAECGTDEETSALLKFKETVLQKESDIEKYCNDKFLLYGTMRKISSGFDRVIGWNLVYARTDKSTYTLRTGFDYEAVEKKEMTAYADNIKKEADVAKNAGVDFLYVQYPYRVDEENSQVPWGAAAYENENADEMLKLLTDASVDVLDLRSALKEDGWEENTGFYATDGHWTTRSGFLSAGILAQYLNENYGFSYEKAYFDEENYEVVCYGLNNPSVKEEVELFLPSFETKLSVLDAYRKEWYEGSFADAAFDLTKADTKQYSTVLTAYSASRIRNSYLFEYVNEKETNNEKRILVCSNSFSWHLLPYLALDTDYVDYVYNITPEQMEYYIRQLSPDMVIVLDRP